MCRVKNVCSKKEFGGGELSFCSHEGYDAKLLSYLLKKSVSTVRIHAEEYGGIKFSGAWYFPHCEVFKYCPEYDTTLPEWMEWFKLGLKCDVGRTALRYKKGYSESLLNYLKTTEDDPILVSFKSEIDAAKDNLIASINLLLVDQALELYNGGLSADYFISKEINYRDLRFALAHGNIFATAKYLNKYHPFRRLYYQYKRKYRNGEGWPAVRKRVIKQSNNMCELCGSSDNLNVHHTEGRLVTEEASLQVLCRACHRPIHYKT